MGRPESKGLPFRSTLWRVFLAVYLPFVLPLLLGHPAESDGCRKIWIENFPGLPGYVPAARIKTLLGEHLRLGGSLQLLPAVLTTLAMVLVLTLVARRGPRWRLGVVLTTSAFATAYAFALSAALAA